MNALFSYVQGMKNRCLHCAAANWCSSSWVTAKRNVPDALVVDLLPAGLELEGRIWPTAAPACRKWRRGARRLLNQMQQADIQHIEFRDDRFVAAVAVNEGHGDAGLSGASGDASYQVPQRRWNRCMRRSGEATGAASGPLTVTP
ncbi:hypothetical protein MJ575_21785 [Klebsiella pneumoniae]|nr:hypothetical protein MJ575_21785 [Klebsiella pneumoniae]